MKTTSAIIKKSISEPMKWPIDITIGPRTRVASCQAPPGMKKVIRGIRMSDTNALTRLPAAPPIITAMASPITPYLLRKDMNSAVKPSGAVGAGGAGLGSSATLIFCNSSRILSSTSTPYLHSRLLYS